MTNAALYFSILQEEITNFLLENSIYARNIETVFRIKNVDKARIILKKSEDFEIIYKIESHKPRFAIIIREGFENTRNNAPVKKDNIL